MSSLGAWNTAVAQLRSSAGAEYLLGPGVCRCVDHNVMHRLRAVPPAQRECERLVVTVRGSSQVAACLMLLRLSAGQNLNHAWKVPLLYSKYVGILNSPINGRECAAPRQ